MSIDVTIKQKLFGGKTMPLEVILGETLHYGFFTNDSLIPGELGQTEFIAYSPEAIGRGFSVVWNPREKKRIDLRLPQPSTHRELREFYAAVERITSYWNGRLTVDGNSVSVSQFLSGLEDMIRFNDRWLGQLAQQVIDGGQESWTLYSAMWPMEMGREEAQRFMDDPEAYARWLHTKQSVDASFAYPQFYHTDSGIAGVFFLYSDTSYLIPEAPVVPFGMTDPATRKPLECENWKAVLIPKGAEEPAAELDYSGFLSQIPQEKRQEFDSRRFLCKPFSQQEFVEMANVKKER